MAIYTQPHAYMPLSGKRYGSFSGKPVAVTSTDIDETDASHFPRRPAALMRRGHAAHNAGSHYGISSMPFWRWRLA